MLSTVAIMGVLAYWCPQGVQVFEFLLFRRAVGEEF